MKTPIFVPTSDEKPELLTISFEDDPKGSLGAQLINCDKVSNFSICNLRLSGARGNIPIQLPNKVVHFFGSTISFYVSIFTKRENHSKCFPRDLRRLDVCWMAIRLHENPEFEWVMLSLPSMVPDSVDLHRILMTVR